MNGENERRIKGERKEEEKKTRKKKKRKKAGREDERKARRKQSRQAERMAGREDTRYCAPTVHPMLAQGIRPLGLSLSPVSLGGMSHTVVVTRHL